MKTEGVVMYGPAWWALAKQCYEAKLDRRYLELGFESFEAWTRHTGIERRKARFMAEAYQAKLEGTNERHRQND